MADSMQEWARRLKAILDEAEIAIESGGDSEAIKKKLDRFQDESPPFADELDITAQLIAIQLNTADTGRALDRLRSQRDKLDRLVKMLGAVTAEAERDAASIRLTRIREAVGAADEAVQSFVKLRKDIETTIAEFAEAEDAEDLQKLASDIESSIKNVLRIKGKIEAFGAS